MAKLITANVAISSDCHQLQTEAKKRDAVSVKHISYDSTGDVRSLSLPGTSQEKIIQLGHALNNFVRLKSLDLSYNALVSIKVGIRYFTYFLSFQL